MPSADEIRDAQRATWAGLSVGWEKWDSVIADQLGPVSAAMIERLAIAHDQQHLDIASGTGEPGLSIAKARAGGRVVLTDLVAQMLDVATRRAQAQGIDNIETQVCSADDLPFADATFDSVSVRFGYMFFPDLDQATAEFTRVLKPGGRLCSSVWVKPEANPWTSIAMQAIATETVVAPPDPDGPNMFRCAAPGSVSALYKSAGLHDIAEWDVDVALVTRSPEQYWDMISEHVSLAVVALQQVDARDERGSGRRPSRRWARMRRTATSGFPARPAASWERSSDFSCTCDANRARFAGSAQDLDRRGLNLSSRLARRAVTAERRLDRRPARVLDLREPDERRVGDHRRVDRVAGDLEPAAIGVVRPARPRRARRRGRTCCRPTASSACASKPSSVGDERDRARRRRRRSSGSPTRDSPSTTRAAPRRRGSGTDAGSAACGERPDRAPAAGPGRGRVDPTVEQRGVDVVVVPVGEIGRRAGREPARACRSPTPPRAWPSSGCTRVVEQRAAGADDQLEERAEQSRLPTREPEARCRESSSSAQVSGTASTRSVRAHSTRTSTSRGAHSSAPSNRQSSTARGASGASDVGREQVVERRAATAAATARTWSGSRARRCARPPEHRSATRRLSVGWSACTTTSTSSARGARRGGRTSGPPTSATRSGSVGAHDDDDPHAGDAAVEQEVGAGGEGGGRREVDDRGRDLLARDHAPERLPPAQRLDARRRDRASSATSRSTHGLQTVPGETQLTRMPWAISSAAIALVSASTAPFDAPYTARSTRPTDATTEQVLTTAPRARGAHRGQERAAHVGHAEHVDREDALPLLGRRRDDVADRARSRRCCTARRRAPCSASMRAAASAHASGSVTSKPSSRSSPTTCRRGP